MQLYLCNLKPWIFDISNYKFYKIKWPNFEIFKVFTISFQRLRSRCLFSFYSNLDLHAYLFLKKDQGANSIIIFQHQPCNLLLFLKLVSFVLQYLPLPPHTSNKKFKSSARKNTPNYTEEDDQIYALILVRRCDLIASLVSTLGTSMRKTNLSGTKFYEFELPTTGSILNNRFKSFLNLILDQ